MAAAFCSRLSPNIHRFAGFSTAQVRRVSAKTAASQKMADVTQKVIDDHNDIKSAYEKIKSSPDAEAQKWFNQLLWTIARHSAAEELIMYPMLDKLGGNGKALADKSREDHLKTKIALSELDGVPLDPQVRMKIDKMMAELLEHIEMEEGPNGDLEVVRKGHNHEELVSAGKSFDRTKMLVPTHPHPGAPDKPPFENVAGLLALPLDKLRDLFRSFPEDAPKK